MINTIIFDFGDVFIDKDKQARTNALVNLGLKEWDNALQELEHQMETGKIDGEAFLKGVQEHIPGASTEQIKQAWNAGIGEFPLYRLEFLQKLSQTYRLFLLSNTDPIHIEKFEQDAGASFYSDFYQCFEGIYFSHEIGVRKPDEEAYYYLINKHEIQPKRTLFIDDKDFNTRTAEKLGFRTWTLKAGEEDVTGLFDKKIISLEDV
ncbi:haloacid dehalogenase [Flavobacterium cyanobacteriorum]|uniref:Haloacid dehalogenase n=1 Tax=Flavobacterium cyanobacteriorum TaxID=2022802 RepID=A0A255Z8H9_9FLAO|nr:HAD family phosphatase [Flavobacterium cyanobacteriorum]OYQ37756.1 haloacid dehalogenase [Flavobacterium cyanobacteriorum]